nr:hypothetical protein BaRGS_018223 [Batillaria attramentaria]
MKSVLVSLALVVHLLVCSVAAQSGGYDDGGGRDRTKDGGYVEPPKTGYEKPKTGYDEPPKYDYVPPKTGYDEPRKYDYVPPKTGYNEPPKTGYVPPYGSKYDVGYGKGDGRFDYDSYYERVNDVLSQLKFAAEALDALDARLSLIKKVLDDLRLITFQSIERRNVEQDNELAKLKLHLTTLEEDLGDLQGAITELENENEINANDTKDLRTWVSSEKRRDTDQDGSVANLHLAVKDFKAKLFLVLLNEFELFSDKVEVTSGKLEDTKEREAARMCETGTVTLKADDRRAEYVFQSTFDSQPGVLYSITGAEVDLDIREEHYAYGILHKPHLINAVGVIVLAYSTPESVTFEAYDLSTGDSAKLSVDVDFQVCSIGPDPW